MATFDRTVGSRLSGDASDLLVQFRWFLVLLGLDLALLVAAIVTDSVFGFPVVGGLMAAFAVLSGTIVLLVGLAMLGHKTF
jgi:hypothetical protein